MTDFQYHVLDQVDAYLHEVLDERAARRVTAHCRDCPICAAALEEARKRFAAMQALPAVEPSERLLRVTEDRIARTRRVWPTAWRGIWGSLAASVLVILGFNVYYANLQPTPYDLRVLGQSELFAGSEAALRVVVVNRATREPISDVPVEIELLKAHGVRGVRVASLKTDALGTASPRLELPEGGDGQYQLRVRALPNGTIEEATRTITLKHTWKVMLSTDKPVYQPGQVIHLRSLALRRPDLKPVAGQAVTYSIVDPKGNKIFQQNGVTSRFGIASGKCPLADEIIHGTYQITCDVAGTSSSSAVEVKPYVLPKFKIGLEFDRPYYEPAARLTVHLRAEYFFGQPVRAGDVEATLESGNPRATLGRATARTDDSGTTSLEFSLPDRLVGLPRDSGDAQVMLTVTVRDPAGQQATRSESTIVTEQPIRIEVVPESGRLVRDLENVVYLFTTYADGRPAPTRITISGEPRELVTTDQGLASINLVPHADSISWTIQATDREGLTGGRAVVLRCGNHAEEFILRTDKALYKGGESMQVVALGGGGEPVFLDLIASGQTIATWAMPMIDGRAAREFSLPPNLAGAIQLCAYRYDAEGWPVRKSRVIYVDHADGINIDVQLDRAEYRPGDRAKLALRMTDAHGKPLPGAVSLAAVDEAVFSVSAQRPGMEQTFFTLDSELLAPVYAIYPWTPRAAAALAPQDRNRFERALFDATSARVDDRDQLREEVRQFNEGDDSIFETLERPDWRELAEGMGMSRELIERLAGERSLHSLALSTYPAKVPQIEQRKHSGLNAVHAAWWAWGIVTGICLLIYLLPRDVVSVLFLVVVCLLLACLLLPAIQTAREAGRRASAINNLKQFGMALENSHDVRRKHSLLNDLTGASTEPRRRQWFPETLLWRPEVITDDQGRAEIEFDLADSITTWRLSASGISADGKLGAADRPIRVFQPFFVDFDLPAALTLGDEASVPVVVYNYLDTPQTVELRLADNANFELLDKPVKPLDLAPKEVRSLAYRLRAAKVGRHSLEVVAWAGEVGDAVTRSVDVVPGGRAVEQVTSGTLDVPATIDVKLPENAIPGSAKLIARIYPTTFSQLVDGLDSIFQQPYGCFEQTSSTTYPNVLALAYLKQTGKSAPAVEAKARAYIHLGYQRLLGFEIAGGGFDWFGSPPANRTLSAYGLMEFEDMAHVYDVDPAVIERTRSWLLSARRGDGSWDSEGRALHDDPTRGAHLARLATTAYIAWAVFGKQTAGDRAAPTLNYLLATKPDQIDEPYVLALVCNALAALDRRGASAAPYVARLESLRRVSHDGKLVSWEGAPDERTMFYGAGRSRAVETTSLAALSLLADGRYDATVRGSLAWIAAQQDASGMWHSTQATVLALKALVAGTGKPLGGEVPRRISVEWDGAAVRELVIPPDEADVTRQLDLSEFVSMGAHRLRLIDRSGQHAGFQAAMRYHVPDSDALLPDAPLAIELNYDRTKLTVDDVLEAIAIVKNQRTEAAPMVIVDLPIPPGFAVEPRAFDDFVGGGRIAKYQLTPRSAIVYLRNLGPSATLELRYQLRATMPVKAASPPALVYEYYDSDRRAASGTALLTIESR
jgi:A-macroglobulin TED domain/Alpha-2-macroglobulin family/MG2 domain/A-macroglobulin receptor binding domain/Protein of unknown function (DUF1559)/Alpha-2-macroglobulin bait region domain